MLASNVMLVVTFESCLSAGNLIHFLGFAVQPWYPQISVLSIWTDQHVKVWHRRRGICCSDCRTLPGCYCALPALKEHHTFIRMCAACTATICGRVASHLQHSQTVSQTNQPCYGSSSSKAAYRSCCVPHLDAGFQAVPLHVQGPIRGVSHPQQQWQQSVGSAADGM